MDFTAINKSNIKVSVNADELCVCGLSGEKLDWKDSRTKAFINDVLLSAKQKFGFEYEKMQISVCVFPSSDGGCELFVTAKQIDFSGYILVADDCEALFLACERLKKTSFDGSSSLYLSDENDFVLVLEKRRLPSYIKAKKYDFCVLSQFGKTYRASEEKKAYVTEHMKLLCENDAVAKLTAIF